MRTSVFFITPKSNFYALIESKKLAEEGDDDMDGFEADTEEEEEEEADMGDAEDGDEADSLRLQKLAAEVSLLSVWVAGIVHWF